jgi:cytoskeletal protein RodZ
MRYLSWMMLAAVALWIGACGSQEQTPATPAPPAVTAPPQAPPPAPAAEPAAPATAPAAPDKPAATTTEPPPAPTPTPAPAVTASAPAKPAVQSVGVPDIIILPSKQGQISFPHQAHAKEYSCDICHGDGTPGGLALPMDVAHSLCRNCHRDKGAGPTTCSGCHKK